jgi:hypothetical protein
MASIFTNACFTELSCDVIPVVDGPENPGGAANRYDKQRGER